MNAPTKKAPPKKVATKPAPAAAAAVTQPEAEIETTETELVLEPAVRLPVNPVKPGDVKLAAQMHNDWACHLPSEYVETQVEDQKTWTFMAPKFKDLDTIRCTAEDGSWIAFAIIRRTVTMEINVQVYDWIELSAPQIAKEIEIGDYLIRHFGTVRKFAVCNRVNNTIVKEGFQTQLQAMKYATDHIQANTAIA